MKLIPLICCLVVLTSCKMAHLGQRHLNRKYERKGLHEKWFKNDAHQVHYWEGGTGETVVLIHGFVGDAQITWDKTLRDLAKDHHVIAPDLQWIGRSTTTDPPSLDAQVDAIHDLLTDRGVSKASFVGISYGGFVVLGVLQRHPELVGKLCIVDSPGMTYDVSQLDTLCKAQNVQSVDEIFVVNDGEGIQKMLDLAMHKDRSIPKFILNDVYDLYFSKYHTQRRELIASLLAEQHRFDTLEVDSLLPVCVIFGAHDAVFPIAEGEKLANFLEVELITIPKAAHAPNVENYKVFQAALRAFLDGE